MEIHLPIRIERRMILQITNSEQKKVISRKILESLHDWFEVIEELWGADNPCQIYVMSLK